MKKVILLLILSFILLLVGCGGGDGSDGTITYPDNSTKEHVKMLEQIEKFSESFVEKDANKLSSTMVSNNINWTILGENLFFKTNEQFVLYIQQEWWDHVQFQKFLITPQTSSEGNVSSEFNCKVEYIRKNSEGAIDSLSGHVQIILERMDENWHIKDMNFTE